LQGFFIFNYLNCSKWLGGNRGVTDFGHTHDFHTI